LVRQHRGASDCDGAASLTLHSEMRGQEVPVGNHVVAEHEHELAPNGVQGMVEGLQLTTVRGNLASQWSTCLDRCEHLGDAVREPVDEDELVRGRIERLVVNGPQAVCQTLDPVLDRDNDAEFDHSQLFPATAEGPFRFSSFERPSSNVQDLTATGANPLSTPS
jgi:hypothetical protein